MRKNTIVLEVLIVFSILGCTKSVRIQDIQGEWAADSGFFYMIIKGDSIAFSGKPYPIIQPPGGKIGYYSSIGLYSPPKIFSKFTIGDANSIIVENGISSRDTLGWLSEYQNQLYARGSTLSTPVRLRHMLIDTSIHLRRIQFSASSNFWGFPGYDMEIHPGEIVVAAPRENEFDANPDVTPRNTFIASLSAGEFTDLERIVQKGLLRDSKAIFEKRAWWIADISYYSLGIFYNDTVLYVKVDMANCPPELTPLFQFQYLFNPVKILPVIPHDTSFAFETRLQLCKTLNDSLSYLNTINSALYRPAQFPGGEAQLQRYVRRALGVDIKQSGTFCFDILIGLTGHIEQVTDAYDPGHAKLFSKFEKILKASPPWIPALDNGRPVKVKKYFCFYNSH